MPSEFRFLQFQEPCPCQNLRFNSTKEKWPSQVAERNDLFRHKAVQYAQWRQPDTVEQLDNTFCGNASYIFFYCEFIILHNFQSGLRNLDTFSWRNVERMLMREFWDLITRNWDYVCLATELSARFKRFVLDLINSTFAFFLLPLRSLRSVNVSCNHHLLTLPDYIGDNNWDLKSLACLGWTKLSTITGAILKRLKESTTLHRTSMSNRILQPRHSCDQKRELDAYRYYYPHLEPLLLSLALFRCLLRS